MSRDFNEEKKNGKKSDYYDISMLWHNHWALFIHDTWAAKSSNVE